MAVTVECPADRKQFLQVILADPDFLDQAFAAVVASWESGPPPKPPRVRVGPPPTSRPVAHSGPADEGPVQRWPMRGDRSANHLPRSPPGRG